MVVMCSGNPTGCPAKQNLLLKTAKSDPNDFLVSTFFDIFSNLFDLNQTDTHKTFFTKSEEFFLTRVKKLFFFFFFFLVEQVENEFGELKSEWFEPDVSTKLVESLLLPFFFLLGMLTLLPSKGSSALPL